jgi:hypothetical protein
MSCFLSALAWAACSMPPAEIGPRDVSFLWTALPGHTGAERFCQEVYEPHEGDLLFFTDRSPFWRLAYLLAYSGPPYHVGIVVRLPDGRLATLEAGPYDSRFVYLIDLLPRLRTHNGIVWVRRLREPLTPEQSARLTDFACEQAGKRFALLRIALAVTPLRSHGPVRSRLFGSACIDRRKWFCSELVLAAAATIGLIDPHVIPPNTVYPRDMFRDQPHNLSDRWEKPLLWTCGPELPPGQERHVPMRCDEDRPLP